MKAFLSHSSKEKEFVRAVAKELGRPFCVLDEQVFETGEEIKEAIDNNLEESSLFVFFASQSSIKSPWVKYEMDQAWVMRMRQLLVKCLVYKIHDSVSIDQLPEWLKLCVIRNDNSPKRIARDIKYHIESLYRDRQNQIFVGRTKDAEALQQALAPLTGDTPRVLVISGLPGIGRRSLLRHQVPSLLNLRKQVIIDIESGDTLPEIGFKISSFVEPYYTPEGLAHLKDVLFSSPKEEVLSRIIDNIRASTKHGELIVLFDAGGLLDQEGNLRDPIRDIINLLEPNDEAYVFVVTARKPSNLQHTLYPLIILKPLKDLETKRLLTLLATREGVLFNSEQASELTEYVAGYPPAAYFCVRQAKDYSPDMVIADKSKLVVFRKSAFKRHIEKLRLSDIEKTIISILAFFSPLPMPILPELVKQDPQPVYEGMARLIDCSLVVVSEDGYIKISEPVDSAVRSLYGSLDKRLAGEIARSLFQYLNRETDKPILGISRVLFRAAKLSGEDKIAELSVRLSGDLVLLCETLYHARDYARATEFAMAAIQERHNDAVSYEFLIKALIQQEKWIEAEGAILEFAKFGDQQSVMFLRGFLERKRGNFPKAIGHYLESERLGRTGTALFRELALCLFLNGEFPTAKSYVLRALDRDKDNPYVIDLLAQIATKTGDEPEARSALNRLEMIDKRSWYWHRKSVVDLAFGYYSEALSAAREAVNQGTTPPFEVVAQLAYCEAKYGDLASAEHALSRLDNEYHGIKRDIRRNLRARAEIRKGQFSYALSLSDQMKDKHSTVYKIIRRDALEGLLHNSALTDSLRIAYSKELDKLKKDLETQQMEGVTLF